MDFTVLGSRGYIGSQLIRYLERQGQSFFAPERDDPSLFIKPLGRVIYCIGLTADYHLRPFDTVRAHVSTLTEILERAQFESLVYLSSTRLYDSSNVALATEDDDLVLNPTNPRHLYDLSKAMGESLCLTTAKGKGRIARLSCVVGPTPDSPGFLPALLRQTIENGRLEVNASPESSRDYVHIEDVVHLLVQIATQGKPQIYNVASGVNASNNDLFQIIEELTGKRLLAVGEAAINMAPQISIRRIRDEFNFSPRSPRVIIRELLSAVER